MRRLAPVLLAAFAGCPDPNSNPPPPPTPANVFITAEDSTVIGTSIHGTVSVSGCKAITQVSVYANDIFIEDTNYSGNPTSWEIVDNQLNVLYSQLGLAAPLVLTARLTCADGRTATSQPTGVTFMPVESVVDMPGSQAVQDAFVAEGGFGGNPTTFIGCVGLQAGVALARMDTNGQVVAYNASLPFNCTYASQITDRATASQTRWLLEPSAGAFAFDTNMNITAILTGKYKAIGVANDGNAILWRDDSPNSALVKATPHPGAGLSPIIWEQTFTGIMNSNPVIDTGTLRTVYASTWQYGIGNAVGNIVVVRYNYDTGQTLNNFGDVILTQTFNPINQPIMPRGTFSNDGLVLYTPLLTIDNMTGGLTSTVLACASAPLQQGCSNSDRKWTSAFFPGVVADVFLFSGGNAVAAVGPQQTYFLNIQTGAVRNLGEKPLTPTGSMVALGVQAGGSGAAFYVLNGPYIDGTPTFPTEIVASDTPENGELWRLEFGAGNAPLGGVYMAVDDADQAWLRIGTKLVKPRSLAAYRYVRGATPVPP